MSNSSLIHFKNLSNIKPTASDNSSARTVIPPSELHQETIIISSHQQYGKKIFQVSAWFSGFPKRRSRETQKPSTISLRKLCFLRCKFSVEWNKVKIVETLITKRVGSCLAHLYHCNNYNPTNSFYDI